MSADVNLGDARSLPGPIGVRPAAASAVPARRRPPRRAAPKLPGEPIAGSAAASPADNTVQVVSTIAHELRTPLATLHAGLEILSDYPDLDAADIRQLVGRLQRGVAWLDCLIENLTTWSAIETGHLALDLAEAPTSAWVESAVDLVQPLLARRDQRVRVSCPDPAPVAFADRVRLGQVVVNLLVNAGKYGVAGDEVALTIAPQGRMIRVAVADHGAGIPAAEREAIFRPRTRGAAASASGVAGHGLGLSIARAIVAAHGGAIGVGDTPGGGATFWFTIPNAE